MIEILYIFIFSLLGFLIGLIISLVPGMHINTTSLLLLSIQTMFWSLSENLGIEPILVPLMISSMIVSAYIASTFSNIIPATFLGAPEEDVALTLLPAHSLLLKGRGYEAIVLSAIGSFGSAVLTLSLLVPIKFLLADPLNLYQNLKSLMPWILIAVIAIMVLTEKTKKAMVISVAVLILSGGYGMVVLKLPLNPLIDFPSTPLFPALAGLFGFSTLISSFISRTEIKSQTIIEPELTESEKKSSIISTITGTLSGIFVSIVPGITTAIGTIIAGIFTMYFGSGKSRAIGSVLFIIGIIVAIIFYNYSGGALWGSPAWDWNTVRDGIASIILPSSILSNTGIYTQAREIILKHFDIIAIAELGSGTFMATGTNTVVLFLRRIIIESVSLYKTSKPLFSAFFIADKI